MEDGSKAVGFFYADPEGKRMTADYFNWERKENARIVLKASDLGITGKFKVRDVWRQKDMGVFDRVYVADVPYHGVVLLRITEL